MELTKYLAVLAVVLPIAYGAPTETASTLHPEMLAAMKRDLGLNSEQAHARVARDLSHTNVIDKLQGSIGQAFAGGWIQGDNVMVGVTDKAAAEQVIAAGATPVFVANSLSKLQDAQKALDDRFINQASFVEGPNEAYQAGIASYYVDITTNKFVIEATAKGQEKAHQFASELGLSASEFEVRKVKSMPVTFATVQGGNAYYIDGRSRCSIGFTVTTGFVSAGHCGRQGSSATTSQSGGALGTFSGSIFPGNDMSYIKTTSGHTLRGTINNYNGGSLPVSGSTQSAVGANICRSGSTTGVHCGTIQQHNTSVTYQEGTINGVTKTTVCAEPGDSGGSYYSGAQAQGVTSGGSGNCQSGGTTYHQPVNPILQRFGVTLVRS